MWHGEDSLCGFINKGSHCTPWATCDCHEGVEVLAEMRDKLDVERRQLHTWDHMTSPSYSPESSSPTSPRGAVDLAQFETGSPEPESPSFSPTSPMSHDAADDDLPEGAVGWCHCVTGRCENPIYPDDRDGRCDLCWDVTDSAGNVGCACTPDEGLTHSQDDSGTEDITDIIEEEEDSDGMPGLVDANTDSSD